MKIFSALLILLFSLNVVAQQPGKIVQTIKGKIIDAASNEPVSYTNIGLEGTFYGTASDSEGNFELKIPFELVEKNIYFSAVGFKNKQFPVKTLFDKEFNIIKIESQSYDIDDVDIAAQDMVLIRILRMASENIPYNFVQGPFNLIAKYSNEKIQGNITTTKNAEVLIYDKSGYKNPSKKDAFQSLKYKLTSINDTNNYLFSDGKTNIDELLELDWARSATSVLNPAILAGYKLNLKDEPNINGKEYWVISFSQEKPTLAGSGDYYANSFRGIISVNKEDYSVLKIEGNIQSPMNSVQGKSLAVNASNSNMYKNVSSNFLIDYENLKPARIQLSKNYLFKGEKISEHSVLEILHVKATNITQLDSRQYFTGE